MSKNSKKIRELTGAMRAERDIRIRNRMIVVMRGLKSHVTNTASDFADVNRRSVTVGCQVQQSRYQWPQGAPGIGRVSRARYVWIRRLVDRLTSTNIFAPKKLRNWIRGRVYIRYSLCSVHRILRLLGFSSRRSATLYVSVADDDTIRQWQADAASTISSAKKRGLTIVVQDESIFLRTGTNRKKLWSHVRDPVTVNRHGRRDRIVVFGALAEDGTKLMRQYERFDGLTFVRYLRKVRRKWGRVLLVTDNASQHKPKEVKKYPKEHDRVEILCLPTATPKLSAVESVWKDAKYRLVTSEHYETRENLTHAVSEHFRTCPIRLDIYRFLYRYMGSEIFNDRHSGLLASIPSVDPFAALLMVVAIDGISKFLNTKKLVSMAGFCLTVKQSRKKMRMNCKEA